MRDLPIVKIFKSNYCKIIFVISLIGVTLLVPKKIFYGWYSLLGAMFILITSVLLTCFVRNIKEEVVSAKASGASLFGIIMIILGIGAIQSCTIGAPVCGASVGAGFLALFFPNVALGFFEKYSVHIILASILIQIAALYFMGCFKNKFREVANENRNCI